MMLSRRTATEAQLADCQQDVHKAEGVEDEVEPVEEAWLLSQATMWVRALSFSWDIRGRPTARTPTRDRYSVAGCDKLSAFPSERSIKSADPKRRR
jgi:hypothetical protein